MEHCALKLILIKGFNKNDDDDDDDDDDDIIIIIIIIILITMLVIILLIIIIIMKKKYCSSIKPYMLNYIRSREFLVLINYMFCQELFTARQPHWFRGVLGKVFLNIFQSFMQLYLAECVPYELVFKQVISSSLLDFAPI